jgi:thiol-disulfide isomerase/thioredoxin
MKTSLSVALTLALALASPGAVPARAAGTLPSAVGAVAPAIKEPTTRGPFDSATSSKPFIVEFFAVWCPHCQREVSVLNRLEQSDGASIDIIAIPASAVGFDRTSPLRQADVDDFMHRFDVKYRIGFNGSFAIPNGYGLAEYPTMYVVDASRHVVAVETGEVPYEELHADVVNALKP